MNNARMWLVVNPTVGLPVFLGAVAVGSFAVHVGIVTNTTWVNDFLSGREMGSTAALEAPASKDGAQTQMATVTFDRSLSGADQTAVIELEDGRTAHVVFDSSPAKSIDVAALDSERGRRD